MDWATIYQHYRGKIHRIFFPEELELIIRKKMQEEIEQIQPTHIVSFIGRTHGNIDGKVYATIDYLEQPDKLQENVRDNPFLSSITCINL